MCIRDSQKRFEPVLAVGSEETGHNITESKFTRSNGERVPIYSGNGLKSALNTLVATQHIAGPPKKYYAKVHRPFNPGFKDTLYVYYIHQNLFFKDSTSFLKSSICVCCSLIHSIKRGTIFSYLTAL